MDGTGGVRTSSRESAEGRALMGGAGVVGVMTELLLAVQPRFLARVESRMRRADGKIVEDIQAMLKVGLKPVAWVELFRVLGAPARAVAVSQRYTGCMCTCCFLNLGGNHAALRIGRVVAATLPNAGTLGWPIAAYHTQGAKVHAVATL